MWSRRMGSRLHGNDKLFRFPMQPALECFNRGWERHIFRARDRSRIAVWALRRMDRAQRTFFNSSNAEWRLGKARTAPVRDSTGVPVSGAQWLPRGSDAPCQRTTSTGIFECVRTFAVSLPSSRLESPFLPCEAIMIRSHFFFFAVSMIC